MYIACLALVGIVSLAYNELWFMYGSSSTEMDYFVSLFWLDMVPYLFDVGTLKLNHGPQETKKAPSSSSRAFPPPPPRVDEDSPEFLGIHFTNEKHLQEFNTNKKRKLLVRRRSSSFVPPWKGIRSVLLDF